MRTLHRGRAARRRLGVTAIELAFGVGLVALIVGYAAQLADVGRGAYLTASTRAAEDLRARRALDRVVEELGVAAASTLVPTPDAAFGTDRLEFRQVVALEGGAATLGAPARLALELGVGELDDGLDNDGDGLVDERRLVLTRDLDGAGEREIVLLRDVNALLQGELQNGLDDNDNGLVDERGFSASLADGLLTLRITTATPGLEAPPTLRTYETSVLLRN